MHILIVEDDEDLSANIGEYFEEAGETVDYAGDGLSGLHLAVTNRYDVLVLDLSLPGIDGLTLCRRLRTETDDAVPILMLTARDTLRDQLIGFETGADDYLTKPFALQELHMRLKALVRRAAGAARKLVVADLVLDTHTLVVRRGGQRIDLTRTELNILELLMRTSPGVATTAMIERALWGEHPPDSDAVLRGHIHHLRKAIDKPFPTQLLRTIRGIGYRIADDDEL